MPSLKVVRLRIASVKSTQKITSAMKMVAAAKLRRSQDAIIAARPYAKTMADITAEVAARAGAEDHPLLRAGGAGRLSRPSPIAGGDGNPPRVPIAIGGPATGEFLTGSTRCS